MIGALGRRTLRLTLLFISLAQIAAALLAMRLRCGKRIPPGERARWLHHSCALLLRRLGIAARVDGPLPRRGLIASNHLGYLDVLIFGAALPCVFVSKSEVRSWPIFGPLTRSAGTIFIDRNSQASTAAVTQSMHEALAANLPVLLFPEGTSSDGSSVLRFHPSLFESAIRAGAPVTPAAISYRAADAPEQELCYYGDHNFAIHLIKLLGRQSIHARIAFSPRTAEYADRKAAAGAAQAEVVTLRAHTAAQAPQAPHHAVETTSSPSLSL
jgi:1-acyl-sn-glycerol-3-phosphate acyltransferase